MGLGSCACCPLQDHDLPNLVFKIGVVSSSMPAALGDEVLAPYFKKPWS